MWAVGDGISVYPSQAVQAWIRGRGREPPIVAGDRDPRRGGFLRCMKQVGSKGSSCYEL